MSCWLTSEQAGLYAHLTTETLRLALPEVTIPSAAAFLPQGKLVAAGNTFAGFPAALVVGRFSAERADLELLSVVVAEPFRRLGFAKQLLDWLHAEAIRLGWASLTLSYPLGHACTPAMTRLTDSQQGWRRLPGLRLVHLDFGILVGAQRLFWLSEDWLGHERAAVNLLNQAVLSGSVHFPCFYTGKAGVALALLEALTGQEWLPHLLSAGLLQWCPQGMANHRRR